MCELVYPWLSTGLLRRNGNIKIPSTAPNPSAALGAAAGAAGSRSGPSVSSKPTGFTGQGRQLGGSSSNTSSGAPASSTASRWPAASIEALTNMGVARDEAVRLLDASNGDV